MMTASMSLSSSTRRKSCTKPGLERRDVGELLVVDALGREVRIDVAERLDLDVLQFREAALEGIALAADADAGHDHAIVGAAHTRTGQGRRVHRGPDDSGGGRETYARRELAP